MVVQNITLPQVDGATGYGLLLSDSAVEGALVRTDDGCSVVLSGYGVSSTASPPSDPQNDAMAPRIVAVVSPNGAIDITTRSFTYAWQANFMPSAAGVCGRTGPDLGANPRDTLMMPSGELLLTGKAGIQMPMLRGFDYNVSRWAASGPFSPLFLSLYNRASCDGVNVRAAYLYRGQLLLASSGTTGPDAGVTLYPGSLTQPRSFAAWPSALLPTAAYNGGTPNGVVQIDDSTIILSDSYYGLVTWVRGSTGQWSVSSKDNWGPDGNNLGTNKVSLETSSGVARVFATSLLGSRTSNAILELLPVGSGPSRFRTIRTSDASTIYRGVAGVPVCSVLPSLAPSPVPSPAPSTLPSGGVSPALLGGSIGGGIAAVGMAAIAAVLFIRTRGTSASFSGPARAAARESGDTRVGHMQRALTVAASPGAEPVVNPLSGQPEGAAAAQAPGKEAGRVWE